MPDRAAKSPGHETRDISVRVVAGFALGLALATAVIGLAVVGLYKLFETRTPSPDSPSRIALHPHMLAPAPQLQANPPEDLARFQADEERKLHAYEWIDRSRGIVRIPIERAMDLIAQRGLPTRGPGTQNASGVTAIDLQKQKATATKP